MGVAAALISLAMLTSAPIMAAGRTPQPAAIITDLSEIKLHEGVNMIPAVTKDGREGMIIKGFYNNISADGAHDDFFVLTQARPEKGGASGPRWYVVSGGSELLSDAPHTVEDQVASVRFARARVNGAPAVLLITATRSMETTIPSPSHVEIKVSRLEPDPWRYGDAFVNFETLRPTACYGNTDLALNRTLGLALPDGYDGPSTNDVCGAE